MIEGLTIEVVPVVIQHPLNPLDQVMKDIFRPATLECHQEGPLVQ
jgi:hypothetical protein